jgi:hypothetical protein
MTGAGVVRRDRRAHGAAEHGVGRAVPGAHHDQVGVLALGEQRGHRFADDQAASDRHTPGTGVYAGRQLFEERGSSDPPARTASPLTVSRTLAASVTGDRSTLASSRN